ncbi:MAG TPA: hypothetical protein V6C81_03570 [Planktothrix sp.]|jgi:hypothetical protein
MNPTNETSKIRAHAMRFHLSIFALLILCTPSAHAEDSFSDLTARWSDAQRLTHNAKELTAQAESLKSQTDHLIAEYSGSVSDNEPSHYDQMKRYSELLSQYHQALNAYMQHRQEMAQHAAQFHQSAQEQKFLGSPVTVTMFKPLKVQAQDACMQAQVQERGLIFQELQLRDAIEYLLTQRGNLTATVYATKWQAAANMAIADHAAAQSFENAIAGKQSSTGSSLSDQVHMAFDSGDFVEAQQTFSNVNQRSSMIQQEVQRVQAHSALAQQFLMRVKLLNPDQPAPGCGCANNNFATNPDAIPDADAQLAVEYQHVQDLYKQVQAAQPRQ